MIQNMSLTEKIGQMVMAGFPGTDINPEFRRLIEDYKLGNIILFSRNVKTGAQVRQLCTDLQELVRKNTGLPAFITVDQEGGMVSRMPEDGTNIPGAMAIAATRNAQNAREAGRITGRELRYMGINVDLAPVLDINCNPHNPVIGVRSYGDKKEAVTEFGIQMMGGLHEEGLMSVIKHFPGHGDTAVDSHLGLPVIDKTIEELEQNELVPFREAIKRGAPCVMSSHILFPAIEKEKIPGTMSHAVITGLLKERLGFDGLVMSDCLEMNAIKDFYGTARGAVGAVKAGVHIVSVSHTPEFIAATCEAIKEAVLSGEIPQKVIDDAVEKIMAYKSKYISSETRNPSGIDFAAHQQKARLISEESITLFRSHSGALPSLEKKVLFMGCYGNRSTLASSEIIKSFNFPDYLSEKMGGAGILFPANPSADDINEILPRTEGFDSIVIGTYNGHLNHGQIELANRLCELRSNIIAVALRNPYDLGLIKGCTAYIAAYEYTRLAFDSLIGVLKGEIPARGVLPVDMN